MNSPEMVHLFLPIFNLSYISLSGFFYQIHIKDSAGPFASGCLGVFLSGVNLNIRSFFFYFLW